MLVRTFSVTNFLNHKETSLDFEPVTVLIGPNNGGKTAIFDALLNFSMLARGRISTAFGPGPYSFGAIRNNEVSRVAPIRFEATLQPESGSPFTYLIEYGQAQRDTYSIRQEVLVDLDGDEVIFDRSKSICVVEGADQYLSSDTGFLASLRRLRFERGEALDDQWPRLTSIAKRVSRITKYRFVPSDLCRPGELPDPLEGGPGLIPRLNYQGGNLAAVLYHLHESEAPALKDILSFLHDAVDGFDCFEFNTTGTNEIGFSVRFSDTRGIVNAPRLSSGTLTLIGFITLLAGPSLGDIVCLEEPENGLTPDSISSLYKAITTAVTAESSTQVILSSHSPFVLATAWNGESRGFVKHVSSENGRSIVRPLSELIEQHELLAWAEFSTMSTETAARIINGP